MTAEFKAVPAVYKCFHLIDLLVTGKTPLGVSAMASALGYHRSTVFNLAYSLLDLGILEKDEQGRFFPGVRFFQLGSTLPQKQSLIQAVRPFLEKINTETGLTAFLGIRSALNAVIIEKADAISGLKVSSEVGDSHPLFAGAGGKALLSQLSDTELDQLITDGNLVAFTSQSCVDKQEFFSIIQNVRKEGMAFDMEEYVDGIRAVAVPLPVSQRVPAAIWAVGLKKKLPVDRLQAHGHFMAGIARTILEKLAGQGSDHL